MKTSHHTMRRSFIFSIDDETVRAKTGKSWAEWSHVLDQWRSTPGQAEITSRQLRNEYELSTWWANTITARYHWECGYPE